MKLKKLTTMLLVLAMVAGIFAGCSNQANPDGTTGSGADAEKNSNGADGGENEDVTLKFLISSSFFDVEGDVTAEATQRLSGYKIDYEVLNGTDQLMLIISSNQAYDYVTLNKTNFNLMMSNGALTDITDLLNEYGQNILDHYSTLWPAVTVDGRIYAIPSVVAQPNSLNRAIIARKDLLEAAGYTEDKLPTTLDSFVKMLEDLKSAYPDMVPLTSDMQYIYSNIGSAYNVLGEQNPYQYLDGHVISVLDNPNLEAYLTTMRDLYARGLLDNEMPAQDTKTAMSKWAAGNAVMVYASWNGCESYIATLRELHPEMDFIVLPLLEDDNGAIHAQTKSGVGAYGGFPITGENTVETIKAINNMMEDDNYKEIVLGVEGVHYNMVDGQIEPIQPAFNDEKNNSNSFVGGFYSEKVYPTYWEVRLKKNADLERCFYEMRSRLLDGGEPSPIALAPTVTVIENLPSLETHLKNTLVSIISGSEDMSALEEEREYWNSNGGDKAVQFYDEWYNANIANN